MFSLFRQSQGKFLSIESELLLFKNPGSWYVESIVGGGCFWSFSIY